METWVGPLNETFIQDMAWGEPNKPSFRLLPNEWSEEYDTDCRLSVYVTTPINAADQLHTFKLYDAGTIEDVDDAVARRLFFSHLLKSLH